MKRKEFMERINQIDLETPESLDLLAELFEEDYLSSKKDLSDRQTVEELLSQAKSDLDSYEEKYDAIRLKIEKELRRAGATEAQINWGLYGNVELSTGAYFKCNFMAKKLIRYSYQILYCLAELKMLSKYIDIGIPDLKQIRQDYGRRYG